jgi:outer membrane protein assembly factor BamB
MFSLQKFIRLKQLSIRILTFITLFYQCILSQDINKTKTSNTVQEFNLSYPFKLCWNSKSKEKVNSTAASDNINYFFYSNASGIIKSLNSESGEKRWETDLGGEIVSTPYIDGENLYIVSKPKENQNELLTDNKVSSDDNEKNIIIRSLSITSGVTIWQTNLKTNLNPEQIFLYIHKSTLLIADKNGNLHSIYKNDGIYNWQKTLGVKLSAPPYFYADKAILGTFEKQLIILSLGEGETYKKIELRIIPTAVSFNTNDDTLIVGDQKGIVLSIKMEKIEKIDFEISKKEKNKKDKSWQFRLGAEVSNINFTSRGLLITSLDNFVYLISVEKGNLIWKRRLAGRISEKSLVFDNYAFITTIAEPTISIVELSTGRLINKIILEDENFVTADPIKIQNKIIVPTLKGLYAFSPSECYEIENQLLRWEGKSRL